VITEEQYAAIDAAIGRIDGKIDRVLEALTGLHTSLADARRDLSVLGEKMVRVQEALYYMASKSMAPEHSEELRSMLPDPPKRRASFR
jgi:hypothetical protein